MKNEAVSRIMLTLLLASMLTLAFNIQVLEANPIPIPSIWMPEEYIDANISLVDGIVQATVNGTYPFAPLGTYYQVMMYYPVPPDADRITVEMNDTKLDWTYGNETYPTVLGNWPMIIWDIAPVPEHFEIETYYEHPVPVIDGNYTFLYAMGTGKYLDYYTKETIAYVSVNISKHVADRRSLIDVYTIEYNAMTEEWTWNPADYIITEEDETWIVTLTVISEMFHPLIEDLLITIKSEPTTWTVDDDGPADFHTIQEAINAANPEDTIYVYNGIYNEHITIDKSLTLQGESNQNTILKVHGDGTLFLGIQMLASNITMSGFKITHDITPVALVAIDGRDSPSLNNTIKDNIFISKEDTLTILESDSNKVLNNLFLLDEAHGIGVVESNSNIIRDNTVRGGRTNIALMYSFNNTILNNIIEEQTQWPENENIGAITILGDWDNSSGHVITENTLRENWLGISFWRSSGSIIYHNDFVNNINQAYTKESTNTWNNGYPSGGNYWSNYMDSDLYSGPFQNETGSDGIGDTPYVINDYNQDNYPLMGPWSPPIERKVGVKVGDWAKYEVAYNYTSNDPTSPFYHPEFAYIEHFKTEVLSVSGTNITFRATTYFENGTEVSKVMWIDISINVIPIPSFFWGAILFTAANLTVGDTLTPNPSSTVINATLMRTYAGAEREVNFVYRRRTFSIMRATPPKEQYIFDRTTYMFWDRATGVLVEANDTTKITTIELDRNYRPLPGGYVYVTNIFTQMTMKETNIWNACMHELAVTSSPMTGITFTINETPQTTPYTELLLEGSYTLEMPETHGEYVWSHWLEDGETNRIKTVTMNTDISLTAVFTPLDTTPPTVSIVSSENKTYTVEDVPLTFTVSESTSWIGYSLDGQANITIAGNTTLTGLSDGMHSLVVYASDIAGNMGSSGVVYFIIQTTAIDTTSPSISFVSPENKTYATTDISLTFTVGEIVSWMAYSLDGQVNVTITGNTTLSGLSDGSHSLIVYAKDAAGNTGASEMVYFSIAILQPDPFPWWILGVTAGIVVIGIALGTFFLRRRKSVKS